MKLELALLAVLSFSAVLNAFVVFLVFRRLRENETSNMARFQINKEATFLDFKMFFVTTVFFLMATSIWFYSESQNNLILQDLGRGMSIISSFFPLAIFYRWWRRFE